MFCAPPLFFFFFLFFPLSGPCAAPRTTPFPWLHLKAISWPKGQRGNIPTRFAVSRRRAPFSAIGQILSGRASWCPHPSRAGISGSRSVFLLLTLIDFCHRVRGGASVSACVVHRSVKSIVHVPQGEVREEAEEALATSPYALPFSASLAAASSETPLPIHRSPWG